MKSRVFSIPLLLLIATPLAAQVRPDLSGVWRLDAAESSRIGEDDSTNEVIWLIDHKDPQIHVVVNVRDSIASHEFTFRCTTDGRECVNELPTLDEVRRITAGWEGDVLVMSQTASTPHGNFEALDRFSVSDSNLVFERTVKNAAGERNVRQVFRKLGPHPSRRPPPGRLASVDLPAELDRVLRDYERHWSAGNADSLVGLITEDGFIARRGGWIRGRSSLLESLRNTSGDLRLRAVDYALGMDVAYIIGAYGYGEEASKADRGIFILTLRRGDAGQWLISADLDRSRQD